MRHLIRKCPLCGEHTLREECTKCLTKTIDPHPPKYSPDDKYVRYRIADRYKEETTDKDYNERDK